jgi:hypothetical protein
MQTVEFNSTVESGVIRIPEQYQNAVGKVVRVILLSPDEPVFGRKLAEPEDFTVLKIPTKGWKFNREEANER